VHRLGEVELFGDLFLLDMKRLVTCALHRHESALLSDACNLALLTLLYESVLRSPQDGRREAELEL